MGGGRSLASTKWDTSVGRVLKDNEEPTHLKSPHFEEKQLVVPQQTESAAKNYF